MQWPYDPIRIEISTQLAAHLAESLKLPPEELQEVFFKSFSQPPDDKLGDLALGTFHLAKILKTSPALLAIQLKEALNKIKSVSDILNNADVAGPYVNLKLRAEGLSRLVLWPILNKKFLGRHTPGPPIKTMVEYSQPNTHKEIHVGHTRNLCLGDALVRTQRALGGDVLTATFPGDVGTHVAKCLWYMKHRNQEAPPKTNKGEWLGTMYTRASLTLEDEEKTSKGDENKAELTKILQELELKRGPYFELWKETRAWSIELMEATYKWADVQFDRWFWESEVDTDSVAWVKALYAQGKLTESQGAIGMDFSEENLGFCLLLKSDGNGLYATKDLELARRKFQDFKIEKSIYIVDTRQSLHFKQVFLALERLGFENAKNCFHLAYNYVELPDGPMSSRKGNIVPLRKLIENMESMIKEQYLSRYAEEWSPEQILETASIVAKGAIKYGMLKQDPNKKIVFNLNEWLELDGDSGPFIQYSYARLQSVKRKARDLDSHQFEGSVLTHPSETSLMVHLASYYQALQQTAQAYKPSYLCIYAFDLAKKINLFYHECPILTAPTPAMQRARYALAEGSGLVLKEVLGLMGIPVPEKM